MVVRVGAGQKSRGLGLETDRYPLFYCYPIKPDKKV